MNIWKHKYPQNIWAKEIVKILKSNSEYTSGTIVDAPCGNGIIGNIVFKELPDSRVLLLDNDTALLSSPYVKNGKIELRIEDIYSFNIEGKNNTWLLINSLYCLPDSDKLISEKMNNFKYIIGLFPRIESSNYMYFTKKNPEFSNPSSKDINSTIHLFNQNGYAVVEQKNLTKLAFHKWNNLFDRLKFPLVLKNIIYLSLEKILFFLSGHYTIIVFKRSE